MPRKIGENSPRNYFTQETENYIIQYNNCTDQDVKNKIFTDHIYFPFYKLAENIIHTFKFYHTDVDQIEDLKLDIVTMLLQEKIGLFDPSRGAKAFSYFGTIVKRWLIAYTKRNYLKQQQQVSIIGFENYSQEEDNTLELTATMTLSDFIDNWVEDTYENLPEIFSKDQDRQIADAVLTVFRTRRDLELFKKKAIYIYVREITKCETPYLTRVILKLKEHFYKKYQQAIDEGILDPDYVD